MVNSWKIKDTYALEVSGDSMIEDHIMSGDYVLVERTQQVNDGDIVVALCGWVGNHIKTSLPMSPRA